MSIKGAEERLYNCKFDSAYEEIKRSKYKNNKKVLNAFKRASDNFGNCGWGGKLIMDTADRLAKMIGYSFPEE